MSAYFAMSTINAEYTASRLSPAPGPEYRRGLTLAGRPRLRAAGHPFEGDSLAMAQGPVRRMPRSRRIGFISPIQGGMIFWALSLGDAQGWILAALQAGRAARRDPGNASMW